LTLPKHIGRFLLAGALGVVGLAAPSPISGPQPASAYSTIYYNGAGRSVPRIGLIGDSTLAAARWYGIHGDLRRYNFVLDAESCRRTIYTSCRGREGYAPENTLTVMRRLQGQWGRVLVLMTGYDDPGWQFAEAVDAVMAEAIRQGIPRVMWLTFRTADVSYVGPTFRSNVFTFRDNNKILLQKALRYGGRLQIADWAGYSARHRDWVWSDGVHLTPEGTRQLTKFIADRAGPVIAGRTITPARPKIPSCRTAVTMRLGDTVRDVRCLERHLRSLGFGVVANGRYGRTEAAAVRFLEYARSWRRDGVADGRVLRAAGVWRARDPIPWCSVQRNLRQGASGPDVTCLRSALAARGYLLAVSPQFVDTVRLAVRHFKREQGLAATGLAGVEALRRLGIHKPVCRISEPLGRGASGPPVACLRQFLAGRGIGIALDGPYFAAVTNGVRKLEARRGLPVDGVADEAFLRAIEAWQ
jgi:peptidoglycan hydrolase-like protein with peptidoglycan-binding domain